MCHRLVLLLKEDIMDNIRTIVGAVIDHHARYRDSLCMIASENVTSQLVRKMASSDLAHRYAEGKVGHRYYQGCEYIDTIESKAVELTKKLFKADHANVQPISGVNANLAAFFATTKHGDTIMSLTVPNGGHISHVKYSAAGICGLHTIPHPFDTERMNINADAMVRAIYENKPKLVLFGASLFLFPHPVAEAREAADDVGANIIYDGAHVLGLIAGGQFQDPLREGADILTGSTHKTFPGPQGAVIMCKKEFAKKIDDAVFPGTVSNHHLHHVAGLAVTLAEMEVFGQDYAKQIIANSKALAQSLYELGFNVMCEDQGFTQSHQVVVDVSDIGGGGTVAKMLENANIISNKNLLPWDDVHNISEPSGLRLGTQELTRIGMKESEMGEIAQFMKRLLMDGIACEKVKSDVIDLKRNHQYIHYCFDKGGAYDCPVGDFI